MKESKLKQIIKEEIESFYNEEEIKTPEEAAGLHLDQAIASLMQSGQYWLIGGL